MVLNTHVKGGPTRLRSCTELRVTYSALEVRFCTYPIARARTRSAILNSWVEPYCSFVSVELRSALP